MAAAPTTFTVSGTAATGAAFDKATITIFDSVGTKFGGAATDLTGADGSYILILPLTAKPPFVVQAARDDKTLVSIIAEAKDTTTNITPITNLIASRLSSSGDPTKLADELKAKPTLFDSAAIKLKVAEIVALIKPLVDAVGDSADPLNGKIAADGKGHDKVLDSLLITITPSSATTANIAVAVKQKLAEGVDAQVISFTNATMPAAPLAAVKSEDLVPSGTAVFIAEFLARLQACYALPVGERVAAGGTAASDVVATACKTLFVGDDPASYKSNGAVVRSGARGAFSSLFGSSATGAKFDRGSYEFTRESGDLVIAYRATDTEGNSANQTLVVRADSTGKLKAIGNQHKYSGGVAPFQQLRTFINQPEANYRSTGYSLNVTPNTVDKVLVTSPNGKTLTLRNRSGFSFMVIVNAAGGLTSTNVIRLRAAFADPALALKVNPEVAEPGLVYTVPQFTDAEISSIGAQGTWKFEYFLAGSPTVADATQFYKTRARALNIPEFSTQPLATLTDADILAIKNNSVAIGTTKYLPTPVTGPLTLNWTVPDGAQPPTSLQIFGSAPVINGVAFNDTASVASTKRTGDIPCQLEGTSDRHCTGASFATGRVTAIQLDATDAGGRSFAHQLKVDLINLLTGTTGTVGTTGTR